MSLPSSPLRFRSQGALCCPSLSPPHEPAPAPTSVPAAGAPLVGRNAAAFAGNKGCGMFLRPAENPASRGGAAAFGGPGALGPRACQTKGAGGGLWPPPAPLAVEKVACATFSRCCIAPLRLRRGQGAMQGNPCYARLFADLTRMSPNPIKASGGCGPRTPGGFSTD